MTARLGTLLRRGSLLAAGCVLAWLTWLGGRGTAPSDEGTPRTEVEASADAAQAALESAAEAADDAADALERLCPSLRRCYEGCCKADEHCNVYQCYVPIPCGEGLAACPSDTYCDDYQKGRAECARMGYGWRDRNAEFCERMEAGSVYLAERKAKWPGATGTCLPILAPHHMRGRWYERLGRFLPRGIEP